MIRSIFAAEAAAILLLALAPQVPALHADAKSLEALRSPAAARSFVRGESADPAGRSVRSGVGQGRNGSLHAGAGVPGLTASSSAVRASNRFAVQTTLAELTQLSRFGIDQPKAACNEISPIAWLFGGMMIGASMAVVVVALAFERPYRGASLGAAGDALPERTACAASSDPLAAGSSAAAKDPNPECTGPGNADSANGDAELPPGASSRSAGYSATEDIESLHHFWPRCGMLLTMLVVQSASSIILGGFGTLVQQHPIIVYFLTMLVGVGGNAGGQSVLLVVRSLAVGRPIKISQQAMVGLKLAAILGPFAFLRCWLQYREVYESAVVGASTAAIAIVATPLGAALPKLLEKMRCDPGHSGALIQVVMDIIGVFAICCIATALLVGFPHLSAPAAASAPIAKG